ncbi:MAG: 16S rRNA (cytidine(1402)-2'-O)-methyltransferase [Clostridiaceae bacterium]|nr:16S rRNA (cytidine(1402)-2'-O)-methyltransferase [Clostridiaceae bacterium]
MSGILYLVATPIGNLEDITFRAIKILKEVDLIAAEDTRHTLKLLNHYEITKPLISYHRHNEDIKVEGLIEKLKEGKNIALVSDAGTPVISDPGEVIVKVAIEENIQVVPIPGACALINALITSGLDTKEFSFYGFISINKKLRKEKLEEIKKENRTIILYEAPHKILSTLNDLESILESRKVIVARELTKIHEEFIRGTVTEILEKYKEPKGEHIIIIEGNPIKQDTDEKQKINEMTVEEHYKYYEKQGFSKNEIIKKIAKDKGVTKNEIYQIFIK